MSLLVCLHQIHTGQQFIGRIDTDQFFSRDIQEIRQPGARADEQGIHSIFIHQFIDRDRFADDHILFKFHAQALERPDLKFDDGFGQPEFRNAVDQNTAKSMQCFVHSDFMTHAHQVAGASQ